MPVPAYGRRGTPWKEEKMGPRALAFAVRRRGLLLLLWPLLLALPALLAAQDAPPAEEGAPAAAQADTSPLSAHVSFTQFVQGPASGGRQREADYAGRIDVNAKVDTRLMGLWAGGAIQAKLATRYGESASGDAGVLSPVNTALIDPAASGTATALIALNYSQVFPFGKTPGNLVIAGLGKYSTVDLPTEAFQAGSGITRFMNVSLIAPLTEARNIPSVTLGATLAVVVRGEPVFSLAVFDPQSSQTTSGLGNLFGNGVTVAPGITLPTRFLGLPGHQQLRGSYSSQRVTAFDQIPRLILPIPSDTTAIAKEHGSWAVTWSADQYFSASKELPRTGWGVFWQLSFADRKTSPVSILASLGLGGTSPIRGRTEDFWGIGGAWNQLSGDFTRVFRPLVELRDEWELEAFYNLALAPWMRLTADLQVAHHSFPHVDTVVLPGVRLHLAF
jgi:porin